MTPTRAHNVLVYERGADEVANTLVASTAEPQALFDLDELHSPTRGPARSPASCSQEARPSPERVKPIWVAGRQMTPSVVFDTYWRFTAARQQLYEARQRWASGPWTSDPVLSVHRFTNCYRAADRVSQFLIKNVIYAGPQDLQDVVFRTLLFKMFNRIATWELLRAKLGEPTWAEFDIDRYGQVLNAAFASGQRLYSAAYVVPPPRLGRVRKHANHLELLQLMMNSGLAHHIADAGSLQRVFRILRGFPAIEDFLGYQFAIDINYSTAADYSEDEFVIAGPGARDGIRKCFGPAADGIEADVIRYMTDHQDEHFARLGLSFTGLRGRPLQLIDCQNLFCEVDKYARVAHPHVIGHSGRQRIKQKYRPLEGRAPAGWFPPKWGINVDSPDSSFEVGRQPFDIPEPRSRPTATPDSGALITTHLDFVGR